MEKQQNEKYFCNHCGQQVQDGQSVTGIVSGSANGLCVTEGHIDGQVTDIENSIVFHDECFLEFAGYEYYPRTIKSDSSN